MSKTTARLKYALLALTILLVTSAPVSAEEDSDQVLIEYFHKPQCKSCSQYVNSEGFDQLIQKLKNEYGTKIYIDWLDVNYQEILERLIAYNISLTPAVVFNREFRLVRGDITKDSLRDAVDALLADRESTLEEERITAVSASLIILSGLVDGVNPCAFALLVFFLSFLTGLHRTRGNVFWMGLAYITGLFAIYLAVGLGILNTISYFGVEHLFGRLGALLLVVMGVLSLRDAFSWEGELLKFPRLGIPIVKNLINKGALPAALILGGFVSMGEFACSGGVYVGILVLLSSEARYWEGVGYLILYNLVFILPLLVILLLGTRAETLARIDRWRVQQRRQMKAVGGVFMILLGIATYYWVFLSVTKL